MDMSAGRNLCALLYKYRVDKNKCIKCGKCAKACQMIVDPVENSNSPECIRCGMCIKECPTEAIHYQYGFGTGKTNLKENKGE